MGDLRAMLLLLLLSGAGVASAAIHQDWVPTCNDGTQGTIITYNPLTPTVLRRQPSCSDSGFAWKRITWADNPAEVEQTEIGQVPTMDIIFMLLLVGCVLAFGHGYSTGRQR